MSKLQIRLDREKQIIMWRLENSQREYDKLADLLKEYNQVFSDDSIIIVKLIRPGRVLAKLAYPVIYDSELDILIIDGLLGRFQGTPYDALTRFRNTHIGFAEACESKAMFNQKYEIDNEDIYPSNSSCDDSDDSQLGG